MPDPSPQPQASAPTGAPAAWPVHCVGPPHRLHRRALGVLLTGRDTPRDPRVAAFEAYAKRAALDPSSLHAALDPAGRPVAAAAALPTPGRAAMVLINPLRGRAEHVAPAAHCVQRSLDTLPADQLAMAQCLLDLDQTDEADALKQAGFHELATLSYLKADLPRAHRSHRLRKKTEPAPLPPVTIHVKASGPNHREPPTEASTQTWDERSETREAFGQAILESYQDTRDCPGLVGTRSLDDIFAGHRGHPGTQPFDPTLWTLFRLNGQPAAVLLLSDLPDTPGLELVYLGVTPRWRGHGLGASLIRYAMAQATQHRNREILLAVDEQNEPALRLYRAAGFHPQQRRRAMVRFFPCLSGNS